MVTERAKPGALQRVATFYVGLLLANRRWLVLATALFVIGLVLGLGMALATPGRASMLLEDTLRALRGSIGPLAGGTLQGVWAVFVNNVRATTISVVFGAIVGIVPALVLLANGVLLGALVGLAGAGITRIPLGLLPLALLPHGIIELPTLVLASAWGLKLGLSWLSPGARGRRLRVLAVTTREALYVYGLVLVLLLVAATIEMLLTYALIRAVTGTAE